MKTSKFREKKHMQCGRRENLKVDIRRAIVGGKADRVDRVLKDETLAAQVTDNRLDFKEDARQMASAFGQVITTNAVQEPGIC